MSSGGSNPLANWDIKVQNGWTRRLRDDDLGCIVFEVAGTNVATAFVVSPPEPRGSLAVSLPFFTMLVKNLKRYFTFEIQIIDDKRMRRRFRFSNYQSCTRVRPFACSVPLALRPGWNQLQLNLANFTARAYGTGYVETLRVQIHANCRVRRVYFSDRIYAEEELPREYREASGPRRPPHARRPPAAGPAPPPPPTSSALPAEAEVSAPRETLVAKTSFRSVDELTGVASVAATSRYTASASASTSASTAYGRESASHFSVASGRGSGVASVFSAASKRSHRLSHSDNRAVTFVPAVPESPEEAAGPEAAEDAPEEAASEEPPAPEEAAEEPPAPEEAAEEPPAPEEADAAIRPPESEYTDSEPAFESEDEFPTTEDESP